MTEPASSGSAANESAGEDLERCLQERIDFILSRDRLASLFNMKVEKAAVGAFAVSALVREEFLNAHDLAHGTLMFGLADLAFALAINSLTDAVGVQYTLTVFRSARAGQKLTADCRVVHRGKRLIVADLKVHGPSGRLLARGQATAMPLSREAAVAGGEA